MTSTFSRIDVHLITTMRSLVEGNPFDKFLPRCATTDRCFVATTAQFITQARNLETTQSKQQLSHQAKPRRRAFCKVAAAAVADDSSLVQHKNQNISFTSVLSLFRVLFGLRHTTLLTVRRSGYEVYHRRTTTMHRTSPFLQSALRTSTHADASTMPPSTTSDHGWASHSFS